jgi:uncharacterized protein YgbK (DUF1537 family)
MLIGAIADDFTGATDLGNMFVQGGLRTLLLLGVPAKAVELAGYDTVIIALKSRSIPAAKAVAQSVEALRWLQTKGAQRYYFKYCSTFDSTPQGNIGPVTDALLDALNEDFTVVVPAYPKYRRTVFQGHLFVGDLRLDESPLRHHPLNPMTDSSLIRLMEAQSKGKAGLVPFAAVHAGAKPLRKALDALRTQGKRYAVIDTVFDEDLHAIAEACAGMRLLTGGSGLALGMAMCTARAPVELTTGKNMADVQPSPSTGAALRPIPLYSKGMKARTGAGRKAVLSGSCSQATLAQIAFAKTSMPYYAVDPVDLAAGKDVVSSVLAWATPLLPASPVLIYSSAEPATVKSVQTTIGKHASHLVEQAIAAIACRLVEAGVETLVVAGGETSGAVVQGLNIAALEIGAEIDPGVPWVYTTGARPLALALKSGNFGAEDFFLKCTS